MNAKFYHHQMKLLRLFVAFLAGSFCTACSYSDDLQECPSGLAIRFKYDYNMKFADAFSNQVNRVTVYVFDLEGRYLMQKTEVGSPLQLRDYYMAIDLEPGTYTLIAWAGLDGSSFEEITEGSSALSERQVRLLTSGSGSSSNLHPLWHGEISEVTVPAEIYKEVTFSLVKDTKQIRVVMQQIHGLPMTDQDFEFEITADNSLFDFHNTVIPNGILTYTPYTSGYSVVGDEEPVTAVFYEASTSRLMENENVRLRVKRVRDGEIVIDIPLIEYLLLTELEGHKETMNSQEYLDRQDEYSLVFFLDDNLSWLKIQIIVNGWTVRINDGLLE